jgi:hypothetical protein
MSLYRYTVRQLLIGINIIINNCVYTSTWNFTRAQAWVRLRHAMGCYLPVISALMFYHSLLLGNEVQSEMIHFGFVRNFTNLTVIFGLYSGKHRWGKRKNFKLRYKICRKPNKIS